MNRASTCTPLKRTRTIAVALACGLFWTSIALSAELEPPFPPIERVSKLTNVGLATSFLLAMQVLSPAGLGSSHQLWKELQAGGGKKVSVQVTQPVRNPNGTIRAHTFTTFDELDRYVGKIRGRYEAYKDEISRRGFQQVESNYGVEAGKGCSKEWFTTGLATTESTGLDLAGDLKFIFAFRQDTKIFFAAVVQDDLVVSVPLGIDASALLPHLIGRFTGKGIDLKEQRSNCSIVLTPTT